MLIHGNYMSRRDVDICLEFDLAGLKEHECIEAIGTLHEALVKEFKAEVSSGAA
ncbi:hypothetical protein D3C83_141980 [compost metagenome]